MTFLRSRRGVVLAGIVLVIALFLIRPGAGWLRLRIIRNVSLALGRPVDIQSVSIRLLPQPAFELGNFVVYDDPAFGAEPMLRAQEVTAALRVTSLLRGRVEISRLSLSEPSVNLSRNGEGHWNLEDLLIRAAQTPVAPTSKPKTEKRPGFPYIESSAGRINFKLGPEKTAYALTNADYALWQDSENTWGMRLKAQPMRTDLNLSDTGVLKVNGTWQRASALRETPLQFTIQWSGAQLGQATKLAYGSDQGWRGAINVSATLSGHPADLRVKSNASVEDFRRYDVVRGTALRLAASCEADYSSAERTLSGIECRAPVGGGRLTLSGSMAALTGSRSYEFSLGAQDLPLQAIAALLRHANDKLPDELGVAGTLDGTAKVVRQRGETQPIWRGSGETTDFRLVSDSGSDVALDRVPFTIVSGTTNALAQGRTKQNFSPEAPQETRLDFGPIDVAMGKGNAVILHGWASRTGYKVAIKGTAQIQRLLAAARTARIPALQPRADGNTDVDLQIAAPWSDPSLVVTGKAQLRQVRAELRGVNAPLEIATANMSLAPDVVTVQSLTASLGDTTWHGSVSVQRQTAEPTDECRIKFDVRADELSTAELGQLLNPHARKRPWYRFLTSSSETAPPFLLTTCATGRITANRMTFDHLPATHVAASVTLNRGRASLSGLTADVLGGKHVGVWQIDFTAKPPEYSGSGVFQRLSLEQLATAMHDGWITGTASANYRVQASGVTAEDLLSSADASLEVDAQNADLPHLTLIGASGPLRIRRMTGRLLLRDGKLAIEAGKLETQGSIYQLSGTASLSRTLDLKLVRDSTHGFNITGTLTDPRVEPASTSETQAALKP